MLPRVLAYIPAGIPAVIGVCFVARFAYVTADTAIDGASSAFLFGMIAVGAYAGPAVALVVAGKGRKGASAILWALALLAMVTNWSQTLGAIAHRGAGTEAERAKAAAAVQDERAWLVRLEREREAMSFVATDTEAVKVAQTAVLAAERTRIAECGNGDPKQRGPNCRIRETDEAAARKAETAAVANKALTGQAAKLDSEAAAIRARLAGTPAVKEGNALGEALGRLLPVSAATAATAQQGLISAIVELLIAAALALPELLRSKGTAKGEDEEAKSLPGAQEVAPEMRAARPGLSLASSQAPCASIIEFAAGALERAAGVKLEFDQFYLAYWEHCGATAGQALPPAEAVEQTNRLCRECGIGIDRRGKKRFLLGVRLKAAPASNEAA